MGLSEHLHQSGARVRLIGCEPYNYPKYARFQHCRTATIADGLLLETPHSQVQARISEQDIAVPLVAESDIYTALKELLDRQALVVAPPSAVAAAFVRGHASELDEPICMILTGENITRDDFARHVAAAAAAPDS